jgi:glutathione S-transferase
VDEDDNVVVFESGAILQYIHSKTNTKQSPSQQAAITSWITWANASLDPICFLETPDGKVYDTGLKRPQKRLDQLEQILTDSQYLTGEDFTVADVAVASYLIYAVQFFPSIASSSSLSRWPKIKQYMKTCAARPTYAQAFGKTTQESLVDQLSEDEEESSSNTKKKILGMF